MKTAESKISLFTTGGTISSKYNNETNCIMLASYDEELVNALPRKNIAIELNKFSNMGSNQISADLGLELALAVNEALQKNDVDGVVVTIGTDTMEEIAYLVHLIVDSEKPVVFTGAMKSQNELYVDAMGNLAGAVKLAASESARNKGVLVYMNQDIHSALYVEKTHTYNMASFDSPKTGLLGSTFGDKVVFHYQPNCAKITKNAKKLNIKKIVPNVVLIRTCWAMSNSILEACIDTNAAGIVLEGMGAGNVPPNLVDSIRKAIKKNIPVVLTSRCQKGMPVDVYGDKGGGANLSSMGVIMGGLLNGIKARVKLMVALSCYKEMDEIRKYFEDL